MENIGEKMKVLRIKKGLSLKELGAKVNLSDTALSKIENGKTKSPSVEIAMKIADVLEVNVYELFSNTPHNLKNSSNEEIANQIINDFKLRLAYAVDHFFMSMSSGLSVRKIVVSDEKEKKEIDKELKNIDSLKNSLFFYLDVNNLLSPDDWETYTQRIKSLKGEK